MNNTVAKKWLGTLVGLMAGTALSTAQFLPVSAAVVDAGAVVETSTEHGPEEVGDLGASESPEVSEQQQLGQCLVVICCPAWMCRPR